MKMTVEYAKERMAFGRPIGAYQAIKHSLGDILGHVECCNVSLLHAAWAPSENAPEGPKVAVIAKAYTSDTYCAITQRSIQMFGGIGFTWEMANHLYFKRARQRRVVRQFANPPGGLFSRYNVPYNENMPGEQALPYTLRFSDLVPDVAGHRLLHLRGADAARAGDLLRAILHPSREPASEHRRDHRSPERALDEADRPESDRGRLRRAESLSISLARPRHQVQVVVPGRRSFG